MKRKYFFLLLFFTGSRSFCQQAEKINIDPGSFSTYSIRLVFDSAQNYPLLNAKPILKNIFPFLKNKTMNAGTADLMILLSAKNIEMKEPYYEKDLQAPGWFNVTISYRLNAAINFVLNGKVINTVSLGEQKTFSKTRITRLNDNAMNKKVYTSIQDFMAGHPMELDVNKIDLGEDMTTLLEQYKRAHR